jgi:hypothetical protein
MCSWLWVQTTNCTCIEYDTKAERVLTPTPPFSHSFHMCVLAVLRNYWPHPPPHPPLFPHLTPFPPPPFPPSHTPSPPLFPHMHYIYDCVNKGSNIRPQYLKGGMVKNLCLQNCLNGNIPYVWHRYRMIIRSLFWEKICQQGAIQEAELCP